MFDARRNQRKLTILPLQLLSGLQFAQMGYTNYSPSQMTKEKGEFTQARGMIDVGPT